MIHPSSPVKTENRVFRLLILLKLERKGVELSLEKAPKHVNLFFPTCVCFVGELLQILSRDIHPSYSAEFYSSYVNILLGVFYAVCRDLRELRHLVRKQAPLLGLLRVFQTGFIHQWFFSRPSRRHSTFQSSVNPSQQGKVEIREKYTC